MTTKMTRTPSPSSRGAGDIGIGPIGHPLRAPDEREQPNEIEMLIHFDSFDFFQFNFDSISISSARSENHEYKERSSKRMLSERAKRSLEDNLEVLGSDDDSE